MPNADHALLVVKFDLADDVFGCSRMMAMVLMADVLRSVFDSGETLALLRDSTAAVLAVGTIRSGCAALRCARVRWLATRRMRRDPELRVRGPVRVREERLPNEHAQACRLLAAAN